MSRRLGETLKSELEDPVQVVEELRLAQRQQTQTVRQVLHAEAEVVARPADSAARGRDAIIGRTREVRPTLVMAVFPSPVTVGSFFQLAFDQQAIDVPPVFARCDRCTLLAENAFEARFHFLQNLSLPMPGTAPTE